MQPDPQPPSPQYNPFKWPPDKHLAQLHKKCSRPGQDNILGIQCPCCHRYQKINTPRWYKRNITNDFKIYGGGIPSYFQLLKYCVGTLSILILFVTVYHIYATEVVCRLIHSTTPQQSCPEFLTIFKFCDPYTIHQTLHLHSRYLQARVFFCLQFLSFIYLILVTIGMKWWIQRMNLVHIVENQKLFSNFSLIIKNIPKQLTISQLRQSILLNYQSLQVTQLFFVYEISQFQQSFRKLFDLTFKIQYYKQSILQNRGYTSQQYNTLLSQYKTLYQTTKHLKKRIGRNNGRAIIVFNKPQHKFIFHYRLRMSYFQKFKMFIRQLFSIGTKDMRMMVEVIDQPQEILWKYVGQSSAKKAKVRVLTTFIGLCFVSVAFVLLYIPMFYDFNNKSSISEKSLKLTIQGILISLVLQFLAFLYRKFTIYLIPKRRPSSKNAQSFFIIISTIGFHYVFYIIAPSSFYVVDITSYYSVNTEINKWQLKAQKIKQLFIAVLTFLVITILLVTLNIRLLLFNKRMKKILSKWHQWGKYCQFRLHQQVTWPSFPIQYRLVIIFNIWSFNALYIFLTPYLVILFVIVIIIAYWLDKKSIYRHYKMKNYQSMNLQLTTQKFYIYLFLICLCVGYAACFIYQWQLYIALGMFILSIIINALISYRKTKRRPHKKSHMTQMTQIIQNQSSPKLDAMLDPSHWIAINSPSMQKNSVASQWINSGYKQRYERYLCFFLNKEINQLLDHTYNYQNMDDSHNSKIVNGREDGESKYQKNNIQGQG